MLIVDVGEDFYHRLTNRNKEQGDGKHTAVDFREKYLSDLDDKNAWVNDDVFIELDFSNVTKIGPSFANEAFAYFTQYASPEKILKKISIKNATVLQKMIIKEELESAVKNK